MGKKILSIILSIAIILSSFPANVFGTKAYAANAEYKIEIVSFTRGEQDNLRSSELLEARLYVRNDSNAAWEVTDNYNGTPITQLNYTWTNNVGTYLYAYNSHNMYGINNTGGEKEIGEGNSFTGTGFAWASIYGANIDNADLMGTIKVVVKDKSGKTIDEASHEGSRERTGGTKNRPVYTYYGIVMPDLAGDISEIAFGLFEGDQKRVLDLLGEAGIVHITCTACSVSNVKVTAQSKNYISVRNNIVTANNPGEATAGGDAKIQFRIEKENCKFHQYKNADGDIEVYVYKKPKTTTTATTLTLTNLDKRCTYYIDGVQGRKVEVGDDNDITNDYIIFEGLTPNTDYTVMAKGKTSDTEAVYAYVYDRTKASLTGTIRVLNHTNRETGGSLTDISDIYPDGKIVFRLAGDLANIETRRTSEGVYSAILSTGTFYPWYTLDGSTYIQGNQQLIVTNKNVEGTIHFYEVSYDLKGGSIETNDNGKTHISGEKVIVCSEEPVRRGYDFVGWKDQYGDIHKPGEVLVNSISKPYLLEAQWEEAVDVNLNVTIDHTAGDGYDYRDDRGDVRLRLVAAESEGSPFLQTGDEITLTKTNHDKHIYSFNAEEITTYYVSNTAIFEDMPKEAIYSIVVDKPGYYIESITNAKNDDGDWTINVKMKYEPETQLLDFTVKVDENVPRNLLPQAAIVKILFWNRANENWEIITQQNGMKPGVRVNFDGLSGTGSYPVWVYDDEDDDLPYYYRIVVTSLVYPDGKIVGMNKEVLLDLTQNETDIYDVVMGANGGAVPDKAEHQGAYFTKADEVIKQKGVLDAVITATGYSVTFDAKGGKVNGEEKQIVKNQYKVPDIENYVPTRAGGYIFNGWYKDEEYLTPAVKGEYLKKDLTLYAKWSEPLKISGNITVDGTYLLESNTHKIHDADRAKSVMVLLQKIDGDEIINVDSKNVAITYENDKGKGTFIFDGLEDNNDYRILVYSANYDSLYRNEPEAETYSDNKTDYNYSDFKAEFGQDKLAKVDAYLTFNPQSFPLKYEIDATAIGTQYRPTSAEMLVLYDDGLKGHNSLYWAVISQMVQGTDLLGQDTSLLNGIGTGEYSVWNQKTSGGTYYDYAIKLNKYTPANGEEKTFDEGNEPFTVEYNGHTHYDAVKGQSQILKAILEPKEYKVVFNLGTIVTDSDNLGDSMDSYHKGDGTYFTTHKWSYVTNIEASPEYNGYEFKGWFIDADGDGIRSSDENYVDRIEAEVCYDVVLTAEWEELPDIYVDVVINHREKLGDGINNDSGKHNISFTVDQKNQEIIGGDFTEIFRKTLNWDGTGTFGVDGYSVSFDSDEQQTTYTAELPTLKTQKKGMLYTVTAAKHGYSIENVKTETDLEGNLRLTVTLYYDPNNFDFTYDVELDEYANNLPDSVKPKAVNVKVTSWYDTPNDTDFGDKINTVKTAWYTITQQRDSYQRVVLDEDGKGTGSYPVWMNATEGNNQVPYYYRIEVVSYELEDGTILSVDNLADNQPSKENIYTTSGNIYTATIETADGCVDPDGAGTNTLEGAYYSTENGQNGQVGSVKAVVSINTHSITVNPAGGKFRDGTTEEKMLGELIQMPDISEYVPTKEGYRFDGWLWSDGSTSVIPLFKGNLLTKNLYITATWTPITYKITYVTNGGELSSDESVPETYTVNDSITHPIPTRSDYVFKGWYDNSFFIGEPEASFDAGQTGDKIYYAKWEYDKVSLTIHKTFRMGTKPDPEQTFIFRIYNEEKGINLKVSIKGAGTVTINDLPRDDNYIVIEETDWSWRYQPNIASQEVDLSTTNNTITFINEKTSNNWINSFSKVVNRFR